LTPFALIGSGLGLGLGALYMAAGLGHAAADHADAERRQAALTVAFSPAVPVETYDLIDPQHAPAVAALERSKPSDVRTSDLDCLTAAVYFEARGETPRGQAAVAQVVMNRVLHPAFPKTVCGVVYQGAGRRSCQFSFACDGVADVRRESGAWRRARQVAVQALAGGGDDEIGSATHFHASGVAPSWGPQMFRVAQIGLHVFYKLRPGGVQPAKRAPAEEKVDVILASAVTAPADQTKLAMLAKVPAPAAEPAAQTAQEDAAPAPAGDDAEPATTPAS
jgi:spore germination cell wall hydrolase CwlJ-like protein